MRGLGSFTVDVESRIARASYGIKVREQFDPDLHDVRDKIWYEDRQQWYADNQMTWTLKAVRQFEAWIITLEFRDTTHRIKYLLTWY